MKFETTLMTIATILGILKSIEECKICGTKRITKWFNKLLGRKTKCTDCACEYEGI